MIANPLADEKVDEETKTLAENASLPPVGPDGDSATEESASTPIEWRINLLDYRAQQAGILDIWRELYGDKRRYVKGVGWYMWNDVYWQFDQMDDVEKEIQSLVDTLNVMAYEIVVPDVENGKDTPPEAKKKAAWIGATSLNNGSVVSLIKMAQRESTISPDRINSGNTLNLQNGVFDLVTYQLREHTPEDMFTYCLPYAYDPSAWCPRWMQFLDEVLVDEQGETDKTLVRLFSQFVGHTLTNETLKKMVFLKGNGDNGKSVAILTVSSLLGDLSTVVDFQRLGENGNYDLPSLVGRRMAVSTEMEKGKGFKEGLIKSIVSGDKVSSRQIYREKTEFFPVCKIWWGMNDFPYVKDTSDGVWGRMITIPFNRTFSEDEKDHGLIKKLESELAGIFNWAIEGLKDLRKTKVFAKSEVAESVKTNYRLDQNPIAQWVEEKVIKTRLYETPAQTAYQEYRKWAMATGNPEANPRTFGDELSKLVEKKEKRTAQGWRYYIVIESDETISARSLFERLSKESQQVEEEDLAL